MPEKSFKIFEITLSKIKIATKPLNIPTGIPIIPKIKPSYKTFFLICFEVAPTEASIPYCLVFSVIEISKLFLIQKTEVTIITITTALTAYNVFVVLSLNSKFSHLNKPSFSENEYLAFPKASASDSLIIPLDGSVIRFITCSSIPII